MKVLFVFSNFSPVGGGCIPIGLSILISIAKQKGHEVSLFDTSYKIKSKSYQSFTNFAKTEEHYKYNVERKYNLEELVKLFSSEVSKLKPDIICFSTMTPTHTLAISLLDAIEEKNRPIVIFGGIHATVAPEEVIQHEKVDILCIGEGEPAFSMLLDRLSAGEDYSDISNLWVKKKGEIFRNSVGAYTKIGSIPIGDFDLFDERHFLRSFKGKTVKGLRVELGRGCVYRCSYCTNKNVKELTKKGGAYFRYKSVKHAIDEFLFYKSNYDLDMLYFKDEVFLMYPKSWLMEFAEEYKTHIKLPFFCQSAAKEISEEKVIMLKEMGCAAVAIGVEVGNEQFRKEVMKKPISNADIKKAVSLLVKHNIRVSTYFMIGLPYETRELIFETIGFQKELYALGTSPTQINCFYPFPGCDMAALVEREGWYNKNFDHNKSTTNAGLDMPQLSAKEIEGLQRTYAAYSRVDKWMYPMIELLEEGSEKDLSMLAVINEHFSEKIEH